MYDEHKLLNHWTAVSCDLIAWPQHCHCLCITAPFWSFILFDLLHLAFSQLLQFVYQPLALPTEVTHLMYVQLLVAA